MIGAGRVLAVIPARGGSKGLPRKNLRCVGDKTLLQHAIDAARASRCVDEVVVSSEDQEILATARRLGAGAVQRPASLAADDTPGVAPLLHVAGEMAGFDIVVLLQPTSPLRVAEDIDACLELMTGQGAPACISVVQVKHHPMWNFALGADGSLAPVLAVADRPDRRQAVPAVYAPNGAVYAARRTWLLEGGALVTGETLGWAMPAERSVDVDTEFDLQVADCIYRLQAGKH